MSTDGSKNSVSVEYSGTQVLNACLLILMYFLWIAFALLSSGRTRTPILCLLLVMLLAFLHT